MAIPTAPKTRAGDIHGTQRSMELPFADIFQAPRLATPWTRPGVPRVTSQLFGDDHLLQATKNGLRIPERQAHIRG